LQKSIFHVRVLLDCLKGSNLTNIFEEALQKHKTQRAAAKALGLSRMAFLNKLFKSRGICVQCKKEPAETDRTRCETCLQKAYKNQDLEAKRLYNQEYYHKNREKLKAYNKDYQKRNLEKFRDARKKFDQTEAGKLSAAKRRARRLKHQEQPMCSADLKLLRFKAPNCENCGSLQDLTLDHHIPLSEGGKLRLENTNILCRVCNSAKKDKMPEDFFSKEVLVKINQKFESFRKYETAKLTEFVIEKGHGPDCRSFIKTHHYLGTAARASYIFALKYEGRLIGVAFFGKPSRQNITVKGETAILELSRFCTLDKTPRNTESYFLSKCLKFLKKETGFKAIVSYADTTEGHTGALYKACNFELLGITRKNYHYKDVEGRRIHKKQVWDRAKLNNQTEKEQAISEGLEKIEELEKFKYGFLLKNTV
jgi:5-methylcytosine-specific restriction endonuclease McrA